MPSPSLPRPIRRRDLLYLGAASTFAALMPGFYRPEDAKAAEMSLPYSWSSVPYGGGGFIDGFLFHPKEKGLLYARTDVGGAYRFDGINKRWIQLLDHLGRDDADLMGVLAIAIDPNDADKLYLACGEYLGTWARDGAILCSADRGATWTKTPLPQGVKLGGNADGRGTGERLAVDPNKGDILFLGTNQDGLFTSTTFGASFTRCTGFAPNSVSFVLIDPKSASIGSASQVIYVGCGTDTGGIYKSIDGGGTFNPMPDLPKLIPQRAAMDTAGNLYVTLSNGRAPSGGTDGAIYKLDAVTGKWGDVSPMKPGGANPSFAYCGLDIDSQKAGTLVVSTMNRWSIHDDIYLSRDGGLHWKALGAQSVHNAAGYPWLVNYLRRADLMGHWIADVKIDPFNSDGMIYGTGYGLWMTGDLGHIDGKDDVHFDFLESGLEETVTLDIESPPAGPMVYAAMGDVGGAGWDDIAKPPKEGLFTPTTESNHAVDFAELAPQYVVRTSDQAPTDGYYSEDGGVNWQPFAASPRKKRNANGERQAVGKICISAKGTALLWLPEKQGAFFSLDMGKTWKASTGLPTFADITLAGVADRAADGVFYIHDRVNSAILVSVDQGASFKQMIMGVPHVEGRQGSQLVAAAGQARDLWLALPSGLFHTPDDKSPMKQVAGIDEAWLVSLGATPPSQTYHAVYVFGKAEGKAGLWRSDDGGETWQRINDDMHQFGNLRCMAADALEFGTLYLGPSGRGVIVGKPKIA